MNLAKGRFRKARGLELACQYRAKSEAGRLMFEKAMGVSGFHLSRPKDGNVVLSRIAFFIASRPVDQEPLNISRRLDFFHLAFGHLSVRPNDLSLSRERNSMLTLP